MVEESKKIESYKAKIKELLKTHPLVDHVKGIEIVFGQDSTGDPAVFITILVEDDKIPSPQERVRLGRFSELATTSLLELDPKRWPYLDFRVPA